MATWDIWEGQCSRYSSAKKFFADARQEFENIILFPIPTEVAFLHGDEFDGLKDWIRSFGWPPAWEDGATWRGDECMKQIDEKAYEYR
jgi:hypothetical protein